MSEIQPNYYAIIPANVRYCPDLEPNAKLLYGEITALAHAQGYCWSSNEYFADLYGVDISTIKRWIASLAKFKFIYVKTIKNGLKWDRKIFISPEVFKNFLRRLKNEPITGNSKNVYEGSKMSLSKAQKCAHNNTSSSDEEEERQKGAAAPNPASSSLFSFFLEELKKHIPEVLNLPDKKTAKSFDKLLENRTEDEIKRVISFAMQDEFWRQHVHSPTYLKSKYEKILTKMNASQKKPKESMQASDIQIETKNRDWWLETQHAVNHQRRFPSSCRFEALESGIIIHNGRDKEGIKFSDPAFQEIIKNALRKWGLR